jgi:hypothetical protein
MNRPLLTLFGALAACVGIFLGSYFLGQRACVATMSHSADDLSWLRAEFHLNDTQMARIRKLHEGYMPQCAKMCTLIAAKQKEVQAALGDNGTNVNAGAQKQLVELGELRAQCQSQMLQHFVAVSRIMPPAEGRRYLAEMEKIALGSHETIEQSMSTGYEHGTN